MHYALSDLHGCYDLFMAMLDKIGFSDEDTLYFLGDAADRGPNGLAVIRELRRRPNVECLLGNHEDMFRRVARVHANKPRFLHSRLFEPVFTNWTVRNGGAVTWESYLSLPESEQQEILDWMENLPTHFELSLNGRDFILAHAGVGAYKAEKELERCALNDFIWERMNYDRVYYRNKYLVTGHTPTVIIDEAEACRMVRRNNHIAIDCGAIYLGTLGCICLDTLEEFYVS